MSEPAIRVQNVSKRYQIGIKPNTTSLPEAVSRALLSPFRPRVKKATDEDDPANLWALKDVSLDVREGEVLGLVGRNGAGKSTLLKILSRITQPTTGEVVLHGRLGSLLEVGTGFHPELTGRENIFLNGAILGMRRTEITRKFDEIVAFAEIERFLDTPVKRYSSGMYTRLAFAVAAHLEPEILLVDEVLAVGDAPFQKKCLGKMEDVGKQGRTVVFVSHNMSAVQKLCHRAIWLDAGKVCDEGKPADVVSRYLKTSFSPLTEREWPDPATAPGNHRVRFRRVCVRPVAGSSDDVLDVNTPLILEFDYENLEPGAVLNISAYLRTEDGFPILATGPVDEPKWLGRPLPNGLFRSSFRIPGRLLNDGTHRVDVHVIKDQSIAILSLTDALMFEVRDDPNIRGGWYGKWEGAVRPQLIWETDLLERADRRELVETAV